MKELTDITLDLWHSHNNYLGKQSVALPLPALTGLITRLFCPGPFYYYVIDSPTLTMDVVSDSVHELLGISPQEFSLASFVNRIHPDDMAFFLRCEDVVAYFLKHCVRPQQMTDYKISYCLRLKNASGNYRVFLLQTVTLKVTDDGALLKVFGSQTDITHLTGGINHQRMSLHGMNGQPSYLELDVFDDTLFDGFTPYPVAEALANPFSRREMEIIRLLGQGLGTAEIADRLAISPQTVMTHRKKILRKAGVSTTTALIASCLRLGYC